LDGYDLIKIALYVLASAALIGAAIGDIRNRRIPRPSGFGLLAIGLIFLLINEMWLEAIFYLVAIWGSRGGWWTILYILFAIILVYRDLESIPFVVGILYVLSMFELGWLGRGDAQIAFGLIAIAADWWIVLYLFIGVIILVIVLSIIREKGLIGAVKRIWWAVRNPPDERALRTPWAVFATAVGLIYLWVWPGLSAGGV
jgi:Flp pilus assembly protein protease CpaA